MAGSFTKDVVASSLGAEWVGYLMALRNLAGVASGVLLGRWSDSVGRFPCYLLALSCEGVMAVAMVSGFWRTAPERQHAMLTMTVENLLDSNVFVRSVALSFERCLT